MGFHCDSKHHEATSARAAALGQILRFVAFLVTETSAHSGVGLGLEADSAAAVEAASVQLLDYGALPKLWPVLATSRRAANAVIASDSFSPADSAMLVEGLADALIRLLCTRPAGDRRSAGGGSRTSPLLTEPRDGRATAACLELLPALCSAGARGIRAGGCKGPSNG